VSQAKATKSPLVVTVCSNGQEHDICVDNSEGDGLDNFQEHIRDLFGIQTNVQLKFTFYCTEPTSGTVHATGFPDTKSPPVEYGCCIGFGFPLHCSVNFAT